MKEKKTAKIMVVAGESGGHVFPAVGFCQELKEDALHAADITFVTTRSPKSGDWIPGEFHPIFLCINKRLVGVLRLVFSAVALLWRIHPDVVFGFGGYVSVPFIVLGRLFGARTLIHEQNVVLGRANRFLAFFAQKIAVSFKATKKYFKKDKKIFLTCYPLRAGLRRVPRAEALSFFGFRDDLLTLLMMGGSQGAHRINIKLLEALAVNANLSSWQVIHLCGKEDFAATRQAYQALPVPSRVFAFLDQMHYAYSAADLVISRSGAGSVFEIMSFALPSILVPYPFAGGHQKENAHVLAAKGAAILLEDALMSPEMINGLLNILGSDSMRRKTMSAIAASLAGESGHLRLIDLVYS